MPGGLKDNFSCFLLTHYMQAFVIFGMQHEKNFPRLKQMMDNLEEYRHEHGRCFFPQFCIPLFFAQFSPGFFQLIFSFLSSMISCNLCLSSLQGTRTQGLTVSTSPLILSKGKLLEQIKMKQRSFLSLAEPNIILVTQTMKNKMVSQGPFQTFNDNTLKSHLFAKR